MNKIIKILSLALVLSLTAMACGDKKECAEGCEKECCKAKTEAVDSLGTEVQGDEQVHVCSSACDADPHSCPNHTHDH
jgi:hypothetical protein